MIILFKITLKHTEIENLKKERSKLKKKTNKTIINKFKKKENNINLKIIERLLKSKKFYQKVTGHALKNY